MHMDENPILTCELNRKYRNGHLSKSFYINLWSIQDDMSSEAWLVEATMSASSAKKLLPASHILVGFNNLLWLIHPSIYPSTHP